MAEFDNGSLHIIHTRLQNLRTQVEAALSDDLSNKDVQAALFRMRDNLNEISQHISDATQYATPIREQISLAASEHITLYSAVLGFVIRSNTTRNPFELYYAFRETAKKFFPDNNVYMILSSEWNYVPFTYPMTLDDLPNFILIGMPAPEADNVLAFPLAGHELGHSIWKQRLLKERFSPRALELTKHRFESEAGLLKSLYPNVSDNEFDNDLFSSRLKDTAISHIITFCLRQLEEIFCDLVRARLFGSAYLYAFRYLLAPTQSGERALEYPELKERATILDRYIAELLPSSVSISEYFTKEDDISHPFQAALVRICDGVRRELFTELCDLTETVFDEAGLTLPSEASIDRVRNSFENTMPVEGSVSLGELICAAWDFYRISFGNSVGLDSKMEAMASNLVLKSAEAIEFKARMEIVS